MHNNLDALDSELAAETNMDVDDSAMEDPNKTLSMFHDTLGAVQHPQTLLKVEELHSDDCHHHQCDNTTTTTTVDHNDDRHQGRR